MKSLFFISIVAITVFASCSTTSKSNVEVEEDKVVEEVPNFSEIDFDEALSAYQAGNYIQAAKHVEAAIKDIKIESANLPKEAKDQVDKSLATLKSIETKIKKGEIADLDMLEKAFIQAETSLAHDYFYMSSIYAIGQPAKAKKSLDKAIKRMEYATKKLKGKSKDQAQELLIKGKALQAKDTVLVGEWEEEAKSLVKEINDWRKKHQAELFYSTNSYYPYAYF